MPALLPNNAHGFVTFYNAMFAPQGIMLQPHLRDPARALMDRRIAKLMIIMGPGAGKSMLCDVAYPAFEIGQDPQQTIIGVSAGEALVQGFQKSIMDWIEYSPTWRNLFPDVRPDKEMGWSSERGMFCTGREPGNPDAQFFGCGLTSSALTGKHSRIQIGDDLHNKETASSTEQCMKVRGDYYKTLLGRADPRGCRFVYPGRRWAVEDILGHLMDPTGDETFESDWVVMVLQAERDGKLLYWDVQVPRHLTCVFTEGNFESDGIGSTQIENVAVGPQ